MMKGLYSALFLILFTFSAAQSGFQQHVSNYTMMSFTYKHNPKWSVYLETQVRSIEDFSQADYYEVKGGPSYNFNKSNQVLIGFGRYGTYKESKFYQREHRIWLQYVLSQRLGKLKLDHRVRAEKRFFRYPQTNTNSNDERYRYRLSATLPLNSKKVQPGTLFANTFEEVFFGPANADTSVFKRNRFFAGFGYQFTHYMNMNLGYMWQKEYMKTSVDKNYHFIYLGINFTLDREKLDDDSDIPVAD